MAGLQPADPELIGPYRLLGRLGAGGMGRVFLGMSAAGRPVAVKVVHAELAANPEFRTRFSHEVAAARKVSGLFTALVVDADVDAPVPWLATAYVAGPSLAEAVNDYGPLPTRQVLSLASSLAKSLGAIHAAGVVHGDLKPSNVLLAMDGPRVIDFGISQAVEAGPLGAEDLVVGTPSYMSPEQAMGKEVGPRSDVFSLGAVLAFAATGEKPFGTGPAPQVLERVVYGSPNLDKTPSEVRPLIERCLAKDPRERPTLSDLLAEAEALIGQDTMPELAIGPLAEYAEYGSLAEYGLVAEDGPAGDDGPGEDARPGQDAAAADESRSGRELDLARDHAPGGELAPADDLRSGRELEPAGALAAPGRLPPADQPGAHGGRRKRPWLTVLVITALLAASAGLGFGVTLATRHQPGASGSQTKGMAPPGRPSPPHITSFYTYQRGQMVYFDIYYDDSDDDAAGFGFVGVNGSDWPSQTHSFSNLAHGIFEKGSIAYPLNQGCGTGLEYTSNVKAWIYDRSGARSQTVTIHLACTT